MLATGGLILLAPVWSESLQRRGLPRGWADLLVVPVAAQMVTMPVIVMISGSVSVVAVLANLLVAPVVAPGVDARNAVRIDRPVVAGCCRGARPADRPTAGLDRRVAHTLARWPSATVPWPATPTGAALLAVLTVVVGDDAAAPQVSGSVRRRGGRRGAGAGAVEGRRARLAAAGWLLTACEVGQGDAMVLSTGEAGTAVVVDTGPEPGLVDACLDRLGSAPFRC